MGDVYYLRADERELCRICEQTPRQLERGREEAWHGRRKTSRGFEWLDRWPGVSTHGGGLEEGSRQRGGLAHREGELRGAEKMFEGVEWCGKWEGL